MALAWILALWAVISVLSGVLSAAPRWFARSLHRHRMWRFRDEVVDRILDGDLPTAHPAVRQLVRDAECAIAGYSKLTLLRVLAFHRIARRLSPKAHAKVAAEIKTLSPEGMSPDEIKVLNEYQERYRLLLTGALLLGSWLGVYAVLAWSVRLAFAERAENRRNRRIRHTMSEATDEAARHTRLGRAASKALEERKLWGPFEPEYGLTGAHV